MTYQREYHRWIRIGLVGVGSHSYRNLLPLLTHLPVDLVALCDVERERAAAAARQYGVERVYEDTAAMYADGDLDAVIICVSPFLHPQLTIEAFDAGLHVWMEKPPGARAGDVTAMLDRQGDRICVVGLKKAFMPAMQKVREIFDDPANGPLRSMLAVYPMALPENGPAALQERKMTRWLADGCHPLAGMLSIGGSVQRVSTFAARHGGGCTILQFESGAVGTLHLADGSSRTQPWELYSFYGNERRVDIENCTRVRFERGIPFEYERTTSFAPPGFDGGSIVWEAQNSLNTLENKATFLQGIYDSLLHFCRAVLDGEPVTIGSLEFALSVTKVYEAVVLAMADGPVEVADV